MKSSAKSLASADVSLRYCTVLKAGSTILLQDDTGLFRARKATSCLVDIMERDVVLISSDLEGNNYVLAIVDRDPEKVTRLVAEGDLCIDAGSGSIALSARDAISLGTPTQLVLSSDNLAVRSNNAEFIANRMSLIGSVLTSSVREIQYFAESLHAVVGSVYQNVVRLFRRIEESEHVRARYSHFFASEELSLHGKQVIVTAEELVKVDGNQIHLG